MPAKLSTHALDTSQGKPAAGLPILLFRLEGQAGRSLLKRVITNGDGRTDEPLLESQEMQAGVYELVFSVGVYFEKMGTASARPAFLEEVPVRFTITDPQGSYHVPLVFSPWSYSTYRGS